MSDATPLYGVDEPMRGAPIEGVVVERDRTRLPQAFVESTTEYDYHELPPALRTRLEAWCDDFYAWAREQGG